MVHSDLYFPDFRNIKADFAKTVVNVYGRFSGRYHGIVKIYRKGTKAIVQVRITEVFGIDILNGLPEGIFAFHSFTVVLSGRRTAHIDVGMLPDTFFLLRENHGQSDAAKCCRTQHGPGCQRRNAKWFRIQNTHNSYRKQNLPEAYVPNTVHQKPDAEHGKNHRKYADLGKNTQLADNYIHCC